MTAKSQSRFHGYMPSGGFTLPEVMVSAILLAGVSLTSTSMMLRSQTSTRSVSLRDATYARISEDLEKLRLASFRFGCEDGMDISASDLIGLRTQYPGLSDAQLLKKIASSCTGKPEDADNAMRYKSGRPAGGTPAPLTAYQQACSNNTLAALLQTKDSRFQNGSQTLALTDVNANAALATANLSIQRTISLNTTDQNKLNISYSTPTGSPVNVKLNTTIVPQALGWCY